MPATLSAIADRRQGQASAITEMHKLLLSAMPFDMEQDAWRKRLFDTIDAEIAAGRFSERGIGLAAGLGPSYINDMRKAGKQPTVPKLIAICDVLNISPSFLMLGVEAPRELENLIRAFTNLPEKHRTLLENYVRSLAEDYEQTPPPAPDRPEKAD